MRITHPEPGFNGSASGIEFVTGEAEIESLSDGARAVLSDNGFAIDGQSATESPAIVADVTVSEHTIEDHPEPTGVENPSEPIEVVGQETDESITHENAAIIQHESGTVEVGTITDSGDGKTLGEVLADPSDDRATIIEPAAKVIAGQDDQAVRRTREPTESRAGMQHEQRLAFAGARGSIHAKEVVERRGTVGERHDLIVDAGAANVPLDEARMALVVLDHNDGDGSSHFGCSWRLCSTGSEA